MSMSIIRKKSNDAYKSDAYYMVDNDKAESRRLTNGKNYTRWVSWGGKKTQVFINERLFKVMSAIPMRLESDGWNMDLDVEEIYAEQGW